MRPNSAVATIDTVVAYVLSDIDMEHEYPTKGEKVAQMVIRGFMEFNLFHLDNIRVSYITVDDNNSFQLPDDFIDYVKLAIPFRGRLWTLTANDKIPLPPVDRCGDQIQTVAAQAGRLPGYFFPDHYNNGSFVGGAYSLTGGFNTAYYRIDKDTRRVFISGVIPEGQVILEYISTGISLSQRTQIPRIAVEPLVARVLYKLALNDPRTTAHRVRDLRDEYENSVRQMRFHIGSMTEDDFKDLHYSSYKMTPKR